MFDDDKEQDYQGGADTMSHDPQLADKAIEAAAEQGGKAAGAAIGAYFGGAEGARVGAEVGKKAGAALSPIIKICIGFVVGIILFILTIVNLVPIIFISIGFVNAQDYVNKFSGKESKSIAAIVELIFGDEPDEEIDGHLVAAQDEAINREIENINTIMNEINGDSASDVVVLTFDETDESKISKGYTEEWWKNYEYSDYFTRIIKSKMYSSDLQSLYSAFFDDETGALIDDAEIDPDELEKVRNIIINNITADEKLFTSNSIAEEKKGIVLAEDKLSVLQIDGVDTELGAEYKANYSATIPEANAFGVATKEVTLQDYTIEVKFKESSENKSSAGAEYIQVLDEKNMDTALDLLKDVSGDSDHNWGVTPENIGNIIVVSARFIANAFKQALTSGLKGLYVGTIGAAWHDFKVMLNIGDEKFANFLESDTQLYNLAGDFESNMDAFDKHYSYRKFLKRSSNGLFPIGAIETEEDIYAYFRANGMTHTGASAMTGHVKTESGYDPNALNPSGAYGLGQWMNGRLDELMTKENYDTLEVQIQFLMEELQKPGGSKYAHAYTDTWGKVTGEEYEGMIDDVTQFILMFYGIGYVPGSESEKGRTCLGEWQKWERWQGEERRKENARDIYERYMDFDLDAYYASKVETKGTMSQEEIEMVINEIKEKDSMTPQQEIVVRYVLGAVGMPYSQAKRNSGEAYDCSSLAAAAWRAAAGIDIGGYTVTQWQNLRDKQISLEELQPGDLIYYHINDSGDNHVVIYIGDGQIVHASCPELGIIRQKLYTSGMTGAVRPTL